MLNSKYLLVKVLFQMTNALIALIRTQEAYCDTDDDSWARSFIIAIGMLLNFMQPSSIQPQQDAQNRYNAFPTAADLHKGSPQQSIDSTEVEVEQLKAAVQRIENNKRPGLRNIHNLALETIKVYHRQRPHPMERSFPQQCSSMVLLPELKFPTNIISSLWLIFYVNTIGEVLSRRQRPIISNIIFNL